MNKHQRYYRKVENFKQRFRKLSSKTIRYRLGIGSLIKEAEIAYREVLEERGEQVFVSRQEAESAAVDDKETP